MIYEKEKRMSKYVSTCPFCGGHEFIKGVQTGYAQVSGQGWTLSSNLCHEICRDCGSVVRSYVPDPEMLVKRRDRRK